MSDVRASALGRARAHALGLMGNLMALARTYSDQEQDELRMVRDELLRAMTLVLQLFPDRRADALTHVATALKLPTSVLVRDALGHPMGLDLGPAGMGTGWTLELVADALGGWLQAHANDA